MKQITVLQILLGILMVSFIVTAHALRENDQEITARLNMIEARQNQIILMAQHSWEPMDLTNLPRVARNLELKRKNKKD